MQAKVMLGGTTAPSSAPGKYVGTNPAAQYHQRAQGGPFVAPAAQVAAPGGAYQKRGQIVPGGAPVQQLPVQPAVAVRNAPPRKKRRLADRTLPPEIRGLVPESEAFVDLIDFEKKLDATIMRKRLDIQEALKRPAKMRRKLRICISNTFHPGKESEVETEGIIPSWELRVEGRLVDEQAPAATAASSVSPQGGANSKPAATAAPAATNPAAPKRKFSSFFKSLVIELDKDIYGPDNHLVEWHRTPNTNETDGFQVKRPGDRNVKCRILLLLDHQPMKFKLDPRLGRLLGVYTDTRPRIIEALWQYVKTQRLQDNHERDYINCDKYLQQVFQCPRMRFMEIPQRLHALLQPPEPVVIEHIISVEPNDLKKVMHYDIDVELDDGVKGLMSQLLVGQQNQQEIQTLDAKIFETVEQVVQLKTQREFFVRFADDPQGFLERWLISQSRDLKTMTDSTMSSHHPELERSSELFAEPWVREAVSRHLYSRVQQKRAEFDGSAKPS